jgi:hypothetical protein
MRRAILPMLPLTTIVIVLLLASAVALAAVREGTSGDDILEGTDQVDTLYGYGGNDQLYGYGSGDVLWGGPGSDRARGGNNNDTIHGEDGNDNLYGDSGNDELRGEDGSDSLTGNAGDDRLYDTGDDDVDEFYCGDGNDTVYAKPNDFASSSCETVNISGADRLPDLSMKTPRNLQIQNTAGQRLLRFDVIIVNLGPGPFELKGQRTNTSTTDMEVDQHVYDSAGGYRINETTAKMFYSGDGHDHWHVRDLEEYELVDDGNILRTGAKQGFCFYDNWNNFKDRTAATDPRYVDRCENGNPNALGVTMGLSRGWGDLYAARLFGQYVNITGLPDGKYRLRVTADKANWFLEESETNNVSYVDIEIRGDTVTILAYGPNAPTVR